MKAIHPSRRSSKIRGLLAGSSIAMCLASVSHAASLTWDGNGSTAPNPNGGTGAWDMNTTANWWNGTTNVVWPSSGTDNDAIFANTAGTVTITSSVTANDLTFNTDGYTITGGTLTLNGTASNITLNTGTATINSVVASSVGAGGISLLGVGSLTFGGTTANTFAGTLKIDTNGADTTRSITFNKTAGVAAIGNNAVINFGIGNTGQSNLRMGASNQFGSGVVMNFQNTSGNWCRFDLMGTSQTLAGLTAGDATTQAGAVVQNREIGGSANRGTSTLTLNGTGIYVYNGYLRDADSGQNGSNQLAIVKSGTGTQSLAGGAIDYTGATSVNTGKLVFLENDDYWSSNITIASGAFLEVQRNNGNVTGKCMAFSGAGTFLKTGNGTLDWSYSNGCTVNFLTGAKVDIQGGIIRLAYGGSANFLNNKADLNIAGGATFNTWDCNTEVRFDSLTGSGTVTRGYTPDVSGANTGTGNFVIGVDNGGGTFDGQIVDNESGTGAILNLIKRGTGTEILTGTNTFRGTTTVEAGSLVLKNSLALSGSILVPSSGIVFDSSVSSHAFTIGGLTGSTNFALVDNAANPIALSLGNDLNATYSGAISGVGGLTKVGTGTQTLTGNNTYTGTTTVVSGILDFGKVTALYGGNSANWTANKLIVNPGATAAFHVGGAGEFTISQFDTLKALSSANGGFMDGAIIGLDPTSLGATYTYNSAIANNGANRLGFAKLGTGTLVLGGANTYTGDTVIAGGTLEIGAGSTFGNAGVYSGNITGAGSLVKSNAGTLTIGGLTANSYAGSTTINNGTLQLGDGSDGSFVYLTSSGYSIASGAMLRLQYNSFGSFFPNWAKFTGAGTLALATKKSFDTFYGTPALPAAFTGTLQIEGGRIATTTAADFGLGGTTKVVVKNGGQLALYNGGTFPLNMTIAGTGYGEPNFEAAVRLGNSTLSGTVTLDGNTTLGAGSGNTATISNPIGQLSTSNLTIGTPALTGLVVLNGANGTYTGGTTLNYGTLQFANNAIGTTGAITMNGGTLQWAGGNTQDISNRLTMVATKNAVLNTNGNNVTFANAIGGGLNTALTKTGGGTLTLSAVNTYTGTTTISGGVLSLNASAPTILGTLVMNGPDQTYVRMQQVNQFGPGVVANFTTASGSWNRFEFFGKDQTLAGINTGSLTTQGGGVIQNSEANGAAGANAVLTLNGSGNYLYRGYVRDFGGGTVGTNTLALTKSGSGTQTLIGDQIRYTGNTTLNSGVLSLVDTTNWQSNIVFAGSGSPALNWSLGNGINLNVSKVISGGSANASFQKTGVGTLTLTGANTYSGALAVNTGTVAVSGTGTLNGLSSLSVASGASFKFLPTTVGGTMTVGALNLSSNSVLSLAWDGTTANKIQASGVATIGSGIVLDVPNSGYTIGTQYTVLQAASGLDTGTYKFVNLTDHTISVAKTATSVKLTPQIATALTTAYWKGGMVGSTNVWAFSDGSTSNWTGTSGGTVQGLVPGTGANVFISNSPVTTAPTSTVLGANMAINGLTIQDTVNGLGLNADGNTLTVNGGGITMNNFVPASTIAANVTLGANQTWTNNSANTLTVSGALGGTGTLTKAGSGTVLISGVTNNTGAININAGTLSFLAPSDANWNLQNSTKTIASGATMKVDLSSQLAQYRQTVLGTTVINSGGFLELSSNTYDVNSWYLIPSWTATGAGTIRITGGGGISCWTGSANPLSGFTGLLDIQDGQFAVNVNGGVAVGSNSMNVNVGTSGKLDLRTGDMTVNALNGVAESAILKSSGGASTLTVGSNNGGGTFAGDISGAFNLVKTGSGTQILSGDNVSTGTTTISGGTLQIGSGGISGGMGTGAVTNNAALVFNRSNDFTVSSAISGSGTVTKLGAGVLTLSGANTYGGLTTISAGGLAVNGSLTGAVTVNNGGALGGTGTVGSVTVNSGGSIRPGTTTNDDGFGTLTMSALTVNSGGKIRVGLGGATDQVVVNGSASFVAGSTVELAVSGLMTAGSTTILNALGGLSATLPNLTLPAPANTTRPQFALAKVGNSLQVNVTGPNALALKWTGINGSNWNVNSTTNFTDGTNGQKFFNLDAVTFDDSSDSGGISNHAVSLVGNLTPSSVTVNSSLDYTFSGGAITGGGKLTKAGFGTLYLNNTNSYTGGTDVNGGVISFGSGGLGSTGPVTMNGGALQWASGNTVDISSRLVMVNGASAILDTNGNDVTFASSFGNGSSGKLVKQGAGTLSLLSAISYTGGTEIDAGTVRRDFSDATGQVGMNTVTVFSGGTLELYNTNSQVDRFLLSANFTGDGTIIKTGAGYVDIWSNYGVSNFAGLIDIQAGTLGSNNSNWQASAGLMSVNVNAGANFDLRFNNVVIDKLTGSGTIGTTYNQSPAPILVVGNSNGSSTFDGVIKNTLSGIGLSNIAPNGSVGLTKNGTGTITLTGNNTYTGATTINSGSLVVNGTLSGSATTINGGILGGTGTVQAVTLSTGIIAPGNGPANELGNGFGNGTGQLNSGDVSMASGTLAVEIFGANSGEYDQLNVTGSVRFDGYIALTIDLGGYQPTETQSFTIVNNDLQDSVGFDFASGRAFVYNSVVLNEGAVFTVGTSDPNVSYAFMITYAGGTNNNDIVLTAVPEPGTAAALLGGIGVLLGMRRRRSSRELV